MDLEVLCHCSQISLNLSAFSFTSDRDFTVNLTDFQNGAVTRLSYQNPNPERKKDKNRRRWFSQPTATFVVTSRRNFSVANSTDNSFTVQGFANGNNTAIGHAYELWGARCTEEMTKRANLGRNRFNDGKLLLAAVCLPPQEDTAAGKLTGSIKEFYLVFNEGRGPGGPR